MEGVFLPLAAMRDRGVYALRSRNLRVGAWDPDRLGFIGIREKFGHLYLFTEYHWEIGAPSGTAKPLRLIWTVPDRVELRERTDVVCSDCGVPTQFRPDVPGTYAPGRWFHVGDGSVLPADAAPVSGTYAPLFDFLTEVEKALPSG